MRIWAHRGCSQAFPENTLLAFEKASALKSLAGIELDIQLTRDGEIVVCHDEKVDRTTDGTGEIRSFSLAELKKLKIDAGNGRTEQVPTMEEVLDLLESRMREGLEINIELKNSNFAYEGMEEQIIEMVHKRSLQDRIVYSSFSALSLEHIREIDPKARIGILDRKISDCLYKLKGGCGANDLHPYWQGMDLPAGRFKGYTVRDWMSGHLFPEKGTGNKLDMEPLERQGITDLILNEPEAYIQ